MAKHITLAVFDYSGKKLCDVYDSAIDAAGQAYDIVYTEELNGWKEQSFTLPYMVDGKSNFRWKYMKSEYKLRLRVGSDEDWFLIRAPKKTKNSRAMTNTITCDHLSTVLKTKNLYVVFDDTNGIGTLPYLINQILMGTGWHIGRADTFLERDGRTEKVRSLSSDGKKGAYQLVTDVCNLFNAYPVYNGKTKTVDFYALRNRKPLWEMTIGRNLSALSVQYDSDNIITRLYVEGEYGDNGYVGIDKVNPTGLTYLMDFDYYKSIGAFTSVHQAALDSYEHDIAQIIREISAVAAEMNEHESALNMLWGQCRCVVYKVENARLGSHFTIGAVAEEQEPIYSGDDVYVINESGFRAGEVPLSGQALEASDRYAVKFITKTAGYCGAKEVAIEAKQKQIDNANKSLEKSITDTRRAQLLEQIEKLRTEITEIYSGTADTEGLNSQMYRAVLLAVQANEKKKQLEQKQNVQADIEATFAAAMGDLLKDGYWSNSNYIEGQEQFLYEDAVDLIHEMAKPDVTYTISLMMLSEAMGMTEDHMKLNSTVRLYDPELEVNDLAFVKKITRWLDNPSKGSVEISNEDITLSGKSLDSILNRIKQQADLIEQKNSLFDRVDETINSDGSIYIERLNGQIDLLKNRLLSTRSSWYTDDSGNIVFEEADGKNAMMLCGNGFMIANGKDDNGDWNWRTFGTGEGFTADAIITGFLSADRIEAGSLALGKLDTNANQTIQTAQKTADGAQSAADKAQNSADNAQSAADKAREFAGKIQNGETGIFFTSSTVKNLLLNTRDGLKITGKDNAYFQVMDNAMGFFKSDGTAMMYYENGDMHLTGAVTATSGYIGGKNGWVIGNGSIYKTASTLGAAGGVYIGTDGISLNGDAFKVTSGGVVTIGNNSGTVNIGTDGKGTINLASFAVKSSTANTPYNSQYASVGQSSSVSHTQTINYQSTNGNDGNEATATVTITKNYTKVATQANSLPSISNGKLLQLVRSDRGLNIYADESSNKTILAPSVTDGSLLGWNVISATTIGATNMSASSMIATNMYVKNGDEYIAVADQKWVIDAIGSIVSSNDVIPSIKQKAESAYYKAYHHSHNVEVAADGTVTLGAVTGTGGSFNVADTKSYKDAVSAVKVDSILISNSLRPILSTDGKTISFVLDVVLTNKKTSNPSFSLDVSAAYKAGQDSVDTSTPYNNGWVAGYNMAVSQSGKIGNTVTVPTTTTSAGVAPKKTYTASYTASSHSYTASKYKESSFNGPGTYIKSEYTKESHSYTASSFSWLES